MHTDTHSEFSRRCNSEANSYVMRRTDLTGGASDSSAKIHARNKNPQAVFFIRGLFNDAKVNSNYTASDELMTVSMERL
jgi:hypothetical protein